MLKKNLVKTGFLGHGLLLFLPIGNIRGNEPIDYMELQVNYQRSISDTGIVQLVDSSTYYAQPDLKEDFIPAPQIQLNRNVSKFVKDFMRKENEFLVKMKKKSLAHFDYMDSVLNKYGLPEELKYLSIVESQLNPKAISKVGAKGMWQFMPVTARELGLKVTKTYDERLNAKKSTVAAAKYLKSLYGEFGDWLLVLAAYNSGPGTVLKAIKRSGSRNFWSLQHFLPAETRGHVKRFIGVHYYFEGTGSITTQTKAEAIAYQKALDKHYLAINEKLTSTDTTNVVVVKALK